MKPCISEATTMPLSFAEDVATFADAGFANMEVWLTKLEKYLQDNSLEATKSLLQDRNLTPAAAAYQGGLLLSQGEQRKVHFEQFRSRLDLCQQLGISVLLVVADFIEKVDVQSLERAVVSLKQAGQWAAGFDVRLALEFRGNSTFCSSLDTALALVGQCDEPNVGVCLDAFHYYTGASKTEDLHYLTKENLFHIQMCDLAGVPRELATDNDRILPGDGDFRLEPMVEHLKTIGYDGCVSLELMNPTLWQSDAAQVAAIGMQSLRRLLPAYSQS